ncbi:MAG: protein-L-isoaspartate O-methyltransferase [Steroidobacteraceae bacterium]
MQTSSATRSQMTYQQIRAWSVLPPETLAVFEKLPREIFVPAAAQGAAYADLAIALGHGEHMLTPTVVGRILQAVTVRRSDHVLEIGTGSGYLTACLALLGSRVLSLEIRPELAQQARQHLKAAGIGNAQVQEADAFEWQPAPTGYDVVVVTGSLPVYDARFESWLKPGGRLFVVTGNAPIMEAQLVRLGSSKLRDVHSLFETVIDPLTHAATPSHFQF